jgi:hypothetical protein
LLVIKGHAAPAVFGMSPSIVGHGHDGVSEFIAVKNQQSDLA